MNIAKLFRIKDLEDAQQFLDQKERVLLFFYGMFMGLSLSWAVAMNGYSTTHLVGVLYLLAVIDLVYAGWENLARLLVVAAYPDLDKRVKRDVILGNALGAACLVAFVFLGLAQFALV